MLMVCGVDRFGMAEALVANGADVTFGDLIFWAELGSSDQIAADSG